MFKFIKRWNEAFLAIILVALWKPSCALIRNISGDETAFVFDAGVLHTLYITMICVAVLGLFTYIGLRINWPFLHDYLEGNFEFHFHHELSSEKKMRFALVIYLSLMFFSAIIFAAICCLA